MPEFTQEQKNAIYSRGCDLLVSAAAGSGKTTVLVERVLSLLEEGIDIDRILIVTFTRAAAGDMKLKLQKRLEDRAGTDERFRLQCDKLPLAAIGTLHSFCSSLIREFFEAAGIDAAYRIMDESEAEKLTLDTLKDVMRDYYAQDTPELRALTCGRNAKKVIELATSLYRFARNRPDSRDWLCRCVSECDPDTQAEKLISILEEDSRASLTEAASLYRRAFGICSEPDGPAHYRACIEGDLNTLEEILSLSGDGFVSAIAAFSQQKAGRAKKSDSFSQEKLDAVKKLRENAKKLIASSGNKLLPTEEAQRDLRELKITLTALRDITLMLDERLTAEKDERGTYDYADLEERAIRVLRNPQTRASVLGRYDAVFVDEYQDISDMQDTIVHLTAPENALFMVGDVKQSIYRFRLAEPGLFLSRQKAYSGGLGGRMIRLSRNFRSRPCILECTNRVFSSSMRGEGSDLEYSEEEKLVPGAAFEGEDPPVEVHILETAAGPEEDHEAEPEEDSEKGKTADSASEAEGMLIASMIHSLIGTPINIPGEEGTRAVTYKDIVILARTRNRLNELKEVLDKEGIPVFADAGGGFSSTMEIRHLLAVLSFIDNRRQDDHLLAAMLSPYVGFTPDDLARIRIAVPEGSLYDAVAACSKHDDELAQRLRDFLRETDKWNLMSRALPLDEFIDRFLRDTGFYAYVGALSGGIRRQGNLDLLCDAAAKYSQDHYEGLHGFLDTFTQTSGNDFGEAQPLGEGDDVVRLMTVHKSKGLEFPIVIGTQCERNFSRRSGNSGEMRMHKDLGFAAEIHSPDTGTRRESVLGMAIDSAVKLESINEEMRLLYVLMTRASERLILLGRVPDIEKEKERWAGGFLPVRSVQSWLDLIMPCFHEISGLENVNEGMVLKTHTASLFPKPGTSEESSVPFERLTSILRSTAEIPEDIQRAYSWQYPYADDVLSPLKLTVTAMSRQITGPAERPKPEEYPEFMRSGSSRALEMGTAMHRALSLISLDALRTDDDIGHAVNGEIRRLFDKGVLSEMQMANTNVGQIIRFYRDSIGQRLLASSSVRREWPFVLRLNASETGDIVTGTSDLLLQGVIDCCFIENGEWVLIDYKTDSAKDIQSLADRYAPQLRLYRKALREITGIPVKETVLFLLRIGRSIRIE